MSRQHGVVELFAGLGCVAQGFARTGAFEVLGLTDIDPLAAANTRANLPGVEYLVADAREVTGERLQSVVGGADISGVLGCPPCQGFSAAGRRDDADVRNSLLTDYFRLVSELRPAFFVMENVPAVLWRPELAAAVRLLDDAYVTWQGVLNAALYGLPQTRQRGILIGYRRELGVIPSCPPPTHGGLRRVFDYASATLVAPTIDNLPNLLGSYPLIGVPGADRAASNAFSMPEDLARLTDLVTVEDALGDIPLEPGQTKYRRAAGTTYANSLRDGSEAVSNHDGWRHRPETIARLAQVSEGGVLGSPGGRNSRYYSQAYARLHRRGLARTVTTNFHNPGSGRFTHYGRPRSLTVREAARLQGLPDSFRLVGDRSAQERLVGNVFPMPWAEAIGRHVARQLDGAL